MGLPERIREAREKLGLNQKELAEKLDVNGFTVSRWERDATAPKFCDMENLAALAGVTMDWLCGRTPALPGLQGGLFVNHTLLDELRATVASGGTPEKLRAFITPPRISCVTEIPPHSTLVTGSEAASLQEEVKHFLQILFQKPIPKTKKSKRKSSELEASND